MMNLLGDMKQYEVDPSSDHYLQIIQNVQHPTIQIYPYPYLNSVRNQYGYVEGDYTTASSAMHYFAFLEFKDVDGLLRHAGVKRSMFLSNTSPELEAFTKQNLYMQTLNNMMLVRDPPDHTRLRRLVNKAFVPSKIAALEGAIKEGANALIDKFIADNEVELVSQFAHLIPINVIAALMGLPEKDFPIFRQWTKDADLALAGAADSQEVRDYLNKINREQRDYFDKLFEEKTKNPKDDLISELLVLEEAGDKLTLDELFATCLLLLTAGHATTTNAIGLSLLHLFRFPEEIAKIKQNPDSLDDGVDELLRYDATISYLVRYAAEEIQYQGKTIPQGSTLFFFLAAGNRDPKVYDEPDVLNLSRAKHEGLTFGRGHHYCLGAQLSRLELKIALQTLFERLPNLNPRRISFPGFMLFRGPDEFHFEF